jgi:glutamate decarboxylase
MIKAHPDFDLVTQPELNLLTYRYVPAWLQPILDSATLEQRATINEALDAVTSCIQKLQRAAGKTFVSRTRIAVPRCQDQILTVFRVVIANPLTSMDNLSEILEEQKVYAESEAEVLQCLATLEQFKDEAEKKQYKKCSVQAF